VYSGHMPSSRRSHWSAQIGPAADWSGRPVMHCWANFPQILAAYDFKARWWNALETWLADARAAPGFGPAAANAASRGLRIAGLLIGLISGQLA
jgi:hypothetical protein